MTVKLVGYGVDTLLLNVRYCDKDFHPVKQELADDLMHELDDLQGEARKAETAVASSWTFKGAVLFVEPHGAGRQWRWLLTCPLLNLTVSRGTFNDLIAQVRFSSQYLWSSEWAGSALSDVHAFLMSIFGEYIQLQVSEVHLCADITGFDFSEVNFEEHFVTRVRKNETIYGVDSVSLDCHRVSTLAFSRHGSPIACSLYNKTLEIQQKSGKTWFYDLWRQRGWDGTSDVWRVEFRFRRAFLHNLTAPIEDAYDILDRFKLLWDYAAGHLDGGEDGLPDGWLRYVTPSEDSNRSRWPVHPVWSVVQSAFSEPVDTPLGAIVRRRIREKNLERGLAAIVGYISTQAAWLGGDYAAPETDLSLVLQWLSEHGVEYLAHKDRDFFEEVLKKQQRYHSANIA